MVNPALLLRRRAKGFGMSCIRLSTRLGGPSGHVVGVCFWAALAACGGGGGGGVLIPPFWSEGSVVVEDFDGDGRVDVAIAAAYISGSPPHPGYIRVYRQATSGVFDAPVDYSIGPDPWGLSAGDVNGDGRLDLIAATPATVAPQVNVVGDSGGVSVLRQNAAVPGSFDPSQWIFTGGAANDAAIAQLTNDRRADVVVADGVLVNGRALLLAQDTALPGAFLQPLSLLAGSGRGSDDLAVGDVNGDGRSDIVLAAYDVVAVFYQSAGGGYDPVLTLAAGKRVSGVALTDLDGDGRTDIVVANAGNAPDGGTGAATVTVLLQTVPGGFVATNIPVAEGARRVAIGDLNDDGLPDVVVISIVYQAPLSTPSPVTVLLQSSTTRGQFAVSGVNAGPTVGTFVAIGDVNDDGLNDIVVNDGPSVLAQRPTAVGTFESARALR